MAKINPQLLSAIRTKTGLSRAQAYARIKQKAGSEYLPNHLAAIKVGSELGVTINRYATAEELGELRRAGSPVTPPSAPAAAPMNNAPSKAAGKSKGGKKNGKTPPNQVFVVHGRDKFAKDAIFDFLLAVGVKPIEWNAAIKMTKKASPFIDDILRAAFTNARAVVVLLTPDDQARLRSELASSGDGAHERRLSGQARPNVLFEAGMAFSSHPDRTVMVQVGKVRPFSDTAGRHVTHMSNDPVKRQELATKLANAGCEVDTSGEKWFEAGDFTDPEKRKGKSSARRKKRKVR